MSVQEDSIQYPPRDWERIKKIGLLADVITPEVYAKRVALGMQLADATLAATKEIVPSLDTIKGLHFIAFERVHSWAGSFRIAGQEVQAGALICSPTAEITKDLEALRKETMDNPLKGSKKYVSEVLAFYHASFLEIHPFLDGNGRISRTILDFQTRKMLGHSLSHNFSRDEYIEALTRAQQDGNLSKLANLIGAKKLTKSIQVPEAFSKEQQKKKKQINISRSDLLKREKELLSQRRKLGFYGTEIDAQYGLGGFPKPLSYTEAMGKAKILSESARENRTKEEIALGLLQDDQKLAALQKKVSDELIQVRGLLLKGSKLEKRSPGLSRRR